jgi:hypothetical protein
MPDYDIFFRSHVPPKVYRELLDKTFGGSWLEWEPETILQELRRVFGVAPTSFVQEKVFALQTFLRTDLFWDDVMAFEDMILAFGDRYVDLSLLQVCLPEELAYGMTVALDLGIKKDFVPDVVEYIRACHRIAGVLVYHPILKFAQPEYSDEFRKNVAKQADSLLQEDSPLSLEVNHEDPVSVQRAKARDVQAYVQERLERGNV